MVQEITFWAYDGGTSTFPALQNQEPLITIDGRKCGVQDLLDKADNGVQLTKAEQDYMAFLLAQEPDCLAFNSHAKKGGENYNWFVCADTCDYSPHIESYEQYFMPKAKVAMDQAYLESNEYLLRKQILEESHRKMREAMK